MTPIGKSEQTISEHLQDMLNDPVLLDEMTGYQIIAVKKAIKLLAEDNNVPIKQPDPITGLVPCEACEDGGWSWLCTRSAQKAADDIYEVEVESKYCPECGRKLTAPPRPGAIGPDAVKMAPNGDEGAKE